MIAVTTFSQKGYETYAHKTLPTIIENFPGKVIVYTEQPMGLEGCEERWFESIPGVTQFYQNVGSSPLLRGMTDSGYNYNYDVWKFSRKVFVQQDVLKDAKEKVFWIDADCFFKSKVPADFLDGLFEGKALCYLGRTGIYTETGFVGFDPQAEGFGRFLEEYVDFFRKARFLKYPRWHDCQAFDVAMIKTGISGNNLSGFFRIPKNRKMSLEDLDVFKKSVLKEYIHHAKGPRKDIQVELRPGAC